jgi:hypothetical protein
MDTDLHTDDEIKEFYNLKNIAVVGIYKNEENLLILYQNIYEE